MHVDWFRFDLASILARELYEVDRLGALFDITHQCSFIPLSSFSTSPATGT